MPNYTTVDCLIFCFFFDSDISSNLLNFFNQGPIFSQCRSKAIAPPQFFITSTVPGTCTLIEALGRQKRKCELLVDCIQKATYLG